MSGDKITNGKLVSLTYSIVDEAGNVVEQNDIPVSYIHGGEVELIGGMDKAVEGKQAGDSMQVLVSPEQGFGARDPSLSYTDDLANVPPEFRHLGAEVPMQDESGEVKRFYVTRIEDGRLTVDGNHPLAGKTLTVNVKIREVRDATKEDAMALSGGPQSIN
ncbi:MAG: FKBP-type peptidyl-prolyl cis-trans isomerase [Chromatiales bacterium]|jgi:FKBP-type peptidyl-prolyl cis-trans isomerase SlyD